VSVHDKEDQRFPHNPNMVDEGRGTDPDRKHFV
jgi:hypothetical protein